MPAYETERLILRSLTVEDTDALLDYTVRNKDFLSQWEPLREASYYTADHLTLLIQNNIETNDAGTGLALHIFNKGDDRIIGSISLSNITRGVFQSCYMGYRLDEAEINNGKMTEAVAKVVEIAFSELKLHRIEANIVPRNLRSIRVVQKLGFVNEGTSKSYLKINGVWEDHIHFVMLNDEMQ